MARQKTPPLDTDSKFPRIELDLVGGETLELPREIEGDWTVVLAYRGHW